MPSAPSVPSPAASVPTLSLMAPGAEALPDLRKPQAGSLAATGDGVRGYYDNFYGFAYVGTDHAFLIRNMIGFTRGGLNVSAPAWSFNDDSYFSTWTEAKTTGGGTVKPFVSIEGDYSIGSTKIPLTLTYGAANALAATESDLQGNWIDDSLTFVVAPDGVFTGSTSGPALGRCTFAGTMNNAEGTSENFFAMRLTAQGGDACRLKSSEPYTGYANIGFKPAGVLVAQGYYRTLQFVVRTESGGFVSGGPGKQ